MYNNFSFSPESRKFDCERVLFFHFDAAGPVKRRRNRSGDKREKIKRGRERRRIAVRVPRLLASLASSQLFDAAFFIIVMNT